jgi:hypothetical protein
VAGVEATSLPEGAAVAYQVVEIHVDGSEQIIERKIIPYPYHSRQEAVETIEGIIGGFNRSGYDAGGGYWWAKSSGGESVRFVLESTA